MGNRKKKNNRYSSKNNRNKKTTRTTNKNKLNSANHSNKSKKENVKTSGPIRKGSELKNLRKKRKEKKDHSKLKKVILILVILFFLILLIAGGVFVGIFFSDKFALTKEELLIGTSNTMIYDAEGNVILELSGKENRKIISLEQMSDYLPKAFVAIEDERFYKHQGIDIKRTAAATFTYVVNSGSSNFGGSTITQQLVKNITNEKQSTGTAGIERKIKEMSRAYQIEQMIEKKDILELYLNLIPLASSGGDICGVEMASIYYFNKSADALTLEECAFIAGVTHSPSQYNPYKENPNTERIKNRTKTVLIKMKELGYVNDEEYNNALAKVNEGLIFTKGELPNSNIRSYFISAAVDQVVNELVEEKGMSVEYAKSRVYGGGLKIYTTQVPSIQQIVETEYKSDKYIKPGKTQENQGLHTQSAMVIMEHTTGKVIGCMGGLGTDVDAIGVNRINGERQPGSSIKPIGVYAPALEKGIINASTIYDNTYPTVFGTKYTPPNATTAKSGLCTIRDALEVSSNIVACKVMSELDPDTAIDFMRQLGITSLVKASDATYTNPEGKVEVEKNDSNLSTALGGVTTGISTLEMAAAYAAIANNGVYIEPTFYTKVEDSSGNVIIESKQESRRVLSEGNAYVMQSLLKQPIEGSSGTARICKMDNMDVAAKTGTTNDQYDLWLCGFTPYYTAATWFGYDYNEYVNSYGGSPATLIWNNVMRQIHTGLEGRRFVKPGNVVSAKVCRTSGKCATASCTNTYVENFVEGAVPSKCEGHTAYVICSETKKLATDYCKKTETVNGLAMPEKEVNAKWKTNSGNKYTVITEKCNVHTEDTTKKEENNNKDTDITVTNVVGLTEKEARAKLGSLTIVIEHKSDSSKKDGVVISQSIKAGAVVSKNAKMTLVINKIQENTNNNSGNNANNNQGNSTNTNNPQTPPTNTNKPETPPANATNKPSNNTTN